MYTEFDDVKHNALVVEHMLINRIIRLSIIAMCVTTVQVYSNRMMRTILKITILFFSVYNTCNVTYPLTKYYKADAHLDASDTLGFRDPLIPLIASRTSTAFTYRTRTRKQSKPPCYPRASRMLKIRLNKALI